ncbi:MAG: cell division protein FtsH, partial [Caldilinea sp.]|jgi:cell division protease FtsH
VLDAEDRRVIAYHEAGHAIVMEALEHTEGVNKITIVSRGQALGYVMPLPEEDRNLRSRAEYEDTLAGLLGGRVAEELIFEEPTTSAANDLERVTKLAKAMVTRFGMSDVIGPLQLNSGDSNPFLGLELGQQRSYSEDVARKIDAEVRRIVSEAYDRARAVLKARQAQLVQVAEALLEKEVLERKEFLQILQSGAPLPEMAAASAD